MMDGKADKRKPVPYAVEPLSLRCEFEECFIVEEDVDSLISHLVSEHISKLTDGDLHCHWKDCEGFTESLPELRRHIYFHAFHTKIKYHGFNLQLQKKLPNCSASIHSRNIVPELPDPLICGWVDCLVVYECAEHYYRHVDSHAKFDSKKSDKGPAVCSWEGCNRTFNDQYKVKEHLRSHTQEKLIACPTCGGMFASRTKFFDHIQRQMPIDEAEDSYVCEYCCRKLSSERLLRDHMRHHVNHYKCPYCDMTCPTPSGLRVHMSYRHSEVKPHSCPYCDYRCKSENDLRKHLESHSMVPTYTCPVENCSYATRSQTCFSVHCRKKHSKKGPLKYACHLCEKIFTRGNYLTKHLLGVHKFRWPSGHCRFRYNLNEDGCFRLQTVRYESLELSEAMMSESAENVDNPDGVERPAIENEPIPDIYSNDINITESQVSNKQVLHSSNPVINGSVVVCMEGGRNSLINSDCNVSEEEPILIKILEAPEIMSPCNNELYFNTSNAEQTLSFENSNIEVLNSCQKGEILLEACEVLPHYESM
uniref:Histone H4 transcription factor n=1 Tax=Parasteatoda tepidariorum TaxID=114398 RepID=A0A2L2YFX7_PARTP